MIAPQVNTGEQPAVVADRCGCVSELGIEDGGLDRAVGGRVAAALDGEIDTGPPLARVVERFRHLEIVVGDPTVLVAGEADIDEFVSDGNHGVMRLRLGVFGILYGEVDPSR